MDTRRGSIVIFQNDGGEEELQDDESKFDTRTPLDKTIDKIGMGKLYPWGLAKLVLIGIQAHISGRCLGFVALVCKDDRLLTLS